MYTILAVQRTCLRRSTMNAPHAPKGNALPAKIPRAAACCSLESISPVTAMTDSSKLLLVGVIRQEAFCSVRSQARSDNRRTQHNPGAVLKGMRLKCDGLPLHTRCTLMSLRRLRKNHCVVIPCSSKAATPPPWLKPTAPASFKPCRTWASSFDLECTVLRNSLMWAPLLQTLGTH